MSQFNLQKRLVLILVVFLFLGVGGALLRYLITAESRINAEVASASELVNRVFTLVELGNGTSVTEESESAYLEALLSLEEIRHIDIRIQSGDAEYPRINLPARDSIDAPRWFVNMVHPDSVNLIRAFLLPGSGDLVSIYPDPGDEVEEEWADLRTRLAATTGFFLLMIAITMVLVRRWVKPVNEIGEVLENVEHGDFSRRIPRFSLPEFRQIGDKVNHLTTWLGSSKAENERLTRKSISVQEKERRYLAQELHDSLGQAVSAIKAIAVSIAERAGEEDPHCATSARNIEEIANSAYDSVRKLMTSLRPADLDELGLVPALNHMVDDWNVHHEDTFCRLRIEGDYSNLHEDQQINIYRIVQEALTNISKYARAENVTITISGREIVSLLIMDDGVGFLMGEVAQRMGLTGIKDRVTLLRGELEISSRPGKGVSIQIEFPRVNHFRRRAGDR